MTKQLWLAFLRKSVSIFIVTQAWKTIKHLGIFSSLMLKKKLSTDPDLNSVNSVYSFLTLSTDACVYTHREKGKKACFFCKRPFMCGYLWLCGYRAAVYCMTLHSVSFCVISKLTEPCWCVHGDGQDGQSHTETQLAFSASSPHSFRSSLRLMSMHP